MLKLGIEIMPEMPFDELIETVCAAEEMGYDYCLMTDEGLMHDAYVTLSALALKTTHIKLAPVTNGYTRHPAVTASALTSLNELSNGRAFVTLVAGGSMVLKPMGIKRQVPLTVVSETAEILKLLWSGESVTWQGERFSLDRARISAHPQQLPIWIAARGPKMLALASSRADGVVLMAQSDLPDALKIVQTSSANRMIAPKRVYLDRIAYTPEMLQEAAILYVYTIVDTPPRMLKNLGITVEEVCQIKKTLETDGPEAAACWVTPEMVRKVMVAGTPQECRQILRDLAAEHRLDIFLLDIVSEGLSANLRLMQDVRDMFLG